jgi:hypothetical protein
MKTMIAALFAALTLLIVASCGDEESAFEYPRVYTYQNFEIRSSQYVELNQDGWESVTPGGNFTSLEDEILTTGEMFNILVILDEITLLDETSVRIKVTNTGTGITIDTTVSYTLQDNQLQIKDYNPNAYFELSEDFETIELCNYTYLHTLLSSQTPYAPINYTFCSRLDGADPVEYVKDQFDWIPGDTVATVFSAWVYELE